MDKKIFTIGYEIPGGSDLILDFSSKKSLMDADILLISPMLPKYNPGFLDISSTYEGKLCYSKEKTFRLKDDCEHWRKEITDFLISGKNIFMILSEKYEFYVYHEEKSYLENGKNKVKTIFKKFNNYQMLGLEFGDIYSASGTEVKFLGNNLFANFFNKFNSQLEYKSYLKNFSGTSIFTGRNKENILGGICKHHSGNIIILPYMNNQCKEFSECSDMDQQWYWTKEGLEFGNNIFQTLVEIDCGLNKSNFGKNIPSWILQNKYKTPKEDEIKTEIEENKFLLEEINKKIHNLEVKLEEESILKGLLYEQGKILERSVIKSLEILGYQAENYQSDHLELDMVIVSPEGYRYIGECEGKDAKGIDITKFRQLSESLNADFARKEVKDKAFGILFGNAQRLLEPEKRAHDFTEKCKISAEREKIGLVRTMDLFEIACYLEKNKNVDFQKQCRQALHNGLGKIVEFPPIPNC